MQTFRVCLLKSVRAMDSEDIWGDELEPACMTLGFPFRQAEGIRWLRISPVGAVKEEAKHRKVHDMTFAGSNEKGGSRSVNTTTGWSRFLNASSQKL